MARNASDLTNVRTDCWMTTTWYQYIYTYRQLCWERGNIHCVRPLGRMHTILVLYCVVVNVILLPRSTLVLRSFSMRTSMSEHAHNVVLNDRNGHSRFSIELLFSIE